MSAASPAPPTWSPGAARDRLSSTLFVAALLHGVVILGITFSAGPERGQAPLSLDVVLVTGEPREAPDPDAALLAQQSTSGTETVEHDRGRMPAWAGQDGPVGLPTDGMNPGERAGSDVETPSNPMVSTTDSSLRIAAAAEAGDNRDIARNLPGESSMLAGDINDAQQLFETELREIEVSANTRESRIAPYLAGWKRRVEQFGTLNYPNLGHSGQAQANPVLEVAISASGELREVRLRRSSGRPELDQAAIGILRAAAPFPPFPEELRSEYDVLRFAYEWRFTGGATPLRTAAGPVPSSQR
ncbi:MAG: TonB family protein [Chromatiales bacterium]|nr:TonB family protein [Chromatiales bacterium]